MQRQEDTSRQVTIIQVADRGRFIQRCGGNARSYLNIDPLFFASHIHSPKKTLDTQTPDLATLPSRSRPGNYISIQYHRTLVFENVVPPANKLFRDANLDRKVMVLPWTSTKRIGLAQHCVSVLYTKENDCYIGESKMSSLLYPGVNPHQASFS